MGLKILGIVLLFGVISVLSTMFITKFMYVGLHRNEEKLPEDEMSDDDYFDNINEE